MIWPVNVEGRTGRSPKSLQVLTQCPTLSDHGGKALDSDADQDKAGSRIISSESHEATTVTYSLTHVVARRGTELRWGTPAVTRQLTERKGLRTLVVPMEEKRKRARRGRGRILGRTGWSIQSVKGGSIETHRGKGCPSQFLDFRVFSNPRTENSEAGR
ncbi:hypothetical protein KM043_011447 [Ampulex compressa]|nr:hypothetical protein KM043_011447 [Ampulex compressa]